jgi:restriction system protein
MTHSPEKPMLTALPGPARDQFLWLDRSNWPGFAGLVAMFYRHSGCSVTEVRGGEPDGGCLLAFCKGGKKILVQCQPWNAAHADAPSVRDLYKTQLEEQADRAVLFTSGVFSLEALNFTAGKQMLLIDGQSCLDLAPQLHQYLLQRQTFPPAGSPRNLFPPNFVAVRHSGNRLSGLD